VAKALGVRVAPLLESRPVNNPQIQRPRHLTWRGAGLVCASHAVMQAATDVGSADPQRHDGAGSGVPTPPRHHLHQRHHPKRYMPLRRAASKSTVGADRHIGR
jgi:hypothetical protein